MSTPICSGRIRHRARVWVTILLGATVASCGGFVESAPEQLSPAPFVVSNPTRSVTGSIAAATTPAAASDVYVSLPAGALPEAVRATVRVERTGVTVSTAVVHGGFDPVVVTAAVGDTLMLTAVDTNGKPTNLRRIPVPPSKPPIIVRSEPPPHKRDVPLNVRIAVVFSEPVDAVSLATAFQLQRGGIGVDGHAEFTNALHTQVQFVPNEPLISATDYEFVVGTNLRDLDGTAISAPIAVPFTTAVVSAQPSDAVLESVSFSVIEFNYPAAPGWYYAPQLVVRESSGRGSARVVSVNFTIPNVASQYVLCAAPAIRLLAGESTALFVPESELATTLSRVDGGRATLGDATVVVTFRNDAGRVGLLQITGPVVTAAYSRPSVGSGYEYFPSNIGCD